MIQAPHDITAARVVPVRAVRHRDNGRPDARDSLRRDARRGAAIQGLVPFEQPEADAAGERVRPDPPDVLALPVLGRQEVRHATPQSRSLEPRERIVTNRTPHTQLN